MLLLFIQILTDSHSLAETTDTTVNAGMLLIYTNSVQNGYVAENGMMDKAPMGFQGLHNDVAYMRKFPFLNATFRSGNGGDLSKTSPCCIYKPHGTSTSPLLAHNHMSVPIRLDQWPRDQQWSLGRFQVDLRYGQLITKWTLSSRLFI